MTDRYNEPNQHSTQQTLCQTEAFDLKSNIKDPIEELIKILKLWRMRHKPWPFHMPRELTHAAKWWIEHQEPADPRFDMPKWVPVPKKDGEQQQLRIDYPYINRICYTLRAYLQMERWKQKAVVDAKQEGFWWRGEHEDVWRGDEKIWLFDAVLEEYRLQKKMGKEEYRIDAVKRMKAIVKKKTESLPYDKTKSLSGDPIASR